jgi:hypothetical protein
VAAVPKAAAAPTARRPFHETGERVILISFWGKTLAFHRPGNVIVSKHTV